MLGSRPKTTYLLYGGHAECMRVPSFASLLSFRALLFCMFEKKKSFLFLSLTLFRPTSVERDYPLN